MAVPECDPEQAWREACDWKEHRRGQLREWAKLTLSQRLEALDEMGEVAAHLFRAGEKRRAEERARPERGAEG